MTDLLATSQHVYFFRIFTNGVERNQTLGLAFTSKDAAWQEASAAAWEIIRDMEDKVHPGLDWRMDVTDAAGDLVYRFAFSAQDLKPQH